MRKTRTRGEIPLDTKGFLHRLYDVLVVVEDRPGVIVGICGPLAEEGMTTHPATRLIAEEYLKPLLAQDIDTLVLGEDRSKPE